MNSIVKISCIFLLLTGSISKASNLNEAGKPIGSITGKVTESDLKNPVSYATVALYNLNDTVNVVKGVVTDDDGKYDFQGIPYGKYDIKISFVGYNSAIIRNVTLDKKKSNLKLSSTPLEVNTTSINEVAVVQERLKGEEEIDKTVFTINDQVRSASTSGLDMLKHIPSVNVDFQHNVTLEGQSDILFYVDGIERNKDFVAQIDPSTIDKVELMTNPGFKYSSDISGVINIILVKEIKHGVNGTVKMDIPHPDKIIMNPRSNIEFGNKNFRTFIGYYSHIEQFNSGSNTVKSINDIKTPYTLNVNGKGQNMWTNHTVNYGLDWFINETSSLNFYSELRLNNSAEKGFVFEETTTINDTITDYQVNNKESENGGHSMYYSLFYKKKFDDKGTELSFELDYYDYDGGHNAEFNYTEYDPDNIEFKISDILFTEIVKNNRNNMKFKTDFTLVKGELKQEVGYRGYYQWMKNSKNMETEMGSLMSTEKFSYDEMRNTAYYSIARKFDKLSLKGGLKYENSTYMIPEKDNISYNILLPQFNASYKLKDNQTLKFTFRKKVYRPGIHDLNPFEIFIDSTTVRKGNPDMKPAINNKAELSYSINFKNNYISPKVYYTFTENEIAEQSLVENNITVISQSNVLKRAELGLSLNGAIQLYKRVRINFYAAGFNRYFENEEDKDEMLSWRANLNPIFMLPKDFVAFVNFNYNSPSIGYQRVFKRDPLFIVGAQKNITKRFKASFFYNPFIKDFKYREIETTYGNSQDLWSGSLDIWQAYCIELTYNFNYGKKVKKIHRSTEYEQDGGGGGL